MWFSIACPVATRRSWTMRSAMLRYLKKLRRPAMPTANRHTRIATRIICGRFVFINVAPHRLHASASWLVGLARVASSLYSCNVIGSLRFPYQVFGQSLVHARMYATSGGARSGVSNSRTRAVLDHRRHEHPETLQT